VSRERFIFGLRSFDVTAAKQILATEGPAEIQEVEVTRLAPLFLLVGVDPDAADNLPDEALDVPLIAITEPDGRTLLIDGYHRLHAATSRGRQTVRIDVLSRAQSERVEDPPAEFRTARIRAAAAEA